MTNTAMGPLQRILRDTSALTSLSEFLALSSRFLAYLSESRPTRIVSPKQTHYIFFQYGDDLGYRITRPLNTRLFIEESHELEQVFARLVAYLDDLLTRPTISWAIPLP